MCFLFYIFRDQKFLQLHSGTSDETTFMWKVNLKYVFVNHIHVQVTEYSDFSFNSEAFCFKKKILLLNNLVMKSSLVQN